MPSIPTREICGLCHRVSAVGFWVPNDVWSEVVHPHYIASIHCLSCFVERADEKLVEWDSVIKFYPVSLRTHIEGCELLPEPAPAPQPATREERT